MTCSGDIDLYQINYHIETWCSMYIQVCVVFMLDQESPLSQKKFIFFRTFFTLQKIQNMQQLVPQCLINSLNTYNKPFWSHLFISFPAFLLFFLIMFERSIFDRYIRVICTFHSLTNHIYSPMIHHNWLLQYGTYTHITEVYSSNMDNDIT